MSKWKMVRLGDVCEIVAGSTPSTSKQEYWDGSFYWVTPAEISDGDYYIERTQRKLTEAGISSAGLRLMPVGTVLLSSRAPIGKVAITAVEMACNQGFKNFVCGEKIHNRFLYYFLKNNKHYLNSLGRGATFKEISKSIVCEVEIPLPPLEEQKRNADILDKASHLIELRKQQLEKMDLLIKSKFIDMFGDPVTNPKGWEVKALGKKCEIVTGNTPPRADKENYGSYIEWIKSDNINTASTILTIAEESLSENGLKKARYVEAGSILMTCIAGSIGCIGNVAIANRRVSFNQQINAIVPEENKSEFMYWLFVMSKLYIQRTVNKSLKGILSKGKLSELQFIFPPIELQNQFAEFVEQVEKQKAVMQKSLEKMETNYKALMQGYFG